MRRLGRYALASALGLAIGCTRAPPFVCTDSSDCADGSFSGVCQDNGYCSFGDPGCDSGQRYGDHAPGELAGSCVEPGATSTSGAATTSASTTIVTLDGASLEQGSLDGTTTTTGGNSSSTGLPGIDGTTTTTDTMTTAPGETQPVEDDTMSLGCEKPAMDECDVCLFGACCAEVTECEADTACACHIGCAEMGMTMDQCVEQCGNSLEFDALEACIEANCSDVCAGS